MKTALITGGTSGTGLCIAKGLLHLGWHVIIIGKTEASCREALNQVPASLQHRLRLLQADLSLRSETLRVSQEALTVLNEIVLRTMKSSHRSEEIFDLWPQMK